MYIVIVDPNFYCLFVLCLILRNFLCCLFLFFILDYLPENHFLVMEASS